MSKDPKYYRLPNSEFTKDPNVYCDAWNKLGNEVAAFFPGYEVHGYDPKVHLYSFDLVVGPAGKLQQRFKDSFVLSVAACNALLSTRGK